MRTGLLGLFAFCVAPLLFGLCACAPLTPAEIPSAAPPPAVESVQVASWKNEELLNGEEDAALLDEALRAGSLQEEAEVNSSKYYTVRLTYDDGSKETYVLIPEPVSERVWIIWEGKTYMTSRKYAEEILNLDILAPVYLDPLAYTLNVSAMDYTYKMPVYEYSFEYLVPSGWKTVSQNIRASYPIIMAASLDEIKMEFEIYPDAYEIRYLDQDGTVIENPRKGLYTCEVEASYVEPTLSRYTGSLFFRFTLELLGTPKITILPKGAFERGGVLFVEVENLRSGTDYLLESTLLQGELKLYAQEDGRAAAFIPVPTYAEAGDYTLSLRQKGSAEKGYSVVSAAEFSVNDTVFDRQDMTVGDDLDSLNTNENYQHDRNLTREAKSKTSEQALWEGPFISPVEGRTTTTFAQERYINGKLSSRHSGIDIAAPLKTPVSAAAAGRVVFAGELIISGNTVIIDHGMNVFSGYSHLDSIAVTQGGMVAQGDQIGTVGSTGFSTGAHLHYTVSIGEIYVNPACFETQP